VLNTHSDNVDMLEVFTVHSAPVYCVTLLFTTDNLFYTTTINVMEQ
jgi:hypothetical protein